MDSKAFVRLESTIHQMKNKLLSDPLIRKLLYYSSSEVKGSLEDLKDVTENAVKDNIYLQLILDIDTKPPFDKRNFIAVRVNNASYYEGVSSYVFNITVASEKHDWVVCDRIRPMLLAQQIINVLEGSKFSLSNEIHYEQMLEQIVNDDVTGYTLIFGASDGTQIAA